MSGESREWRDICPHCWGPHRETNYTCAVSEGWYTCGACARRYDLPESVTTEQADALRAEALRIGPDCYRNFTEDDLRGISGVVIREEVKASGWTFPPPAPVSADLEPAVGEEL